MDKRLLPIKVWDWPTRVGHWALALSFGLAYLTAESEAWRLVHVVSGLVAGGLIAFRLLWGWVGTRHARFAGFVRGPRAALHYLKALLRGKPPHFTGHNPAAGLAVMGLLAVGLLSVMSGWVVYHDLAPGWWAEIHEALVHVWMMLILVHLAGVAMGCLAHRENLVRAMFTGRKLGLAFEAIETNRAWVLPLMLAWMAIALWLFW